MDKKQLNDSQNSSERQSSPDSDYDDSVSSPKSKLSNSKSNSISNSNSNSYSNCYPTLIMEPELYKHLFRGETKDAVSALVSWADHIWELKTPKHGNSVLHIAAANSSQPSLISHMLPMSRGTIKKGNSKGDLAFHSAAKAGRLETLKALTAWERYDPKEREIDERLLGWENDAGDTPLHIALDNNQVEMAEFLVDQYGRACFQLNKKMISPIYLGITAKHWHLEERMISIADRWKEEAGVALFRGKSVVHALIEANNLDILKKVLESYGNLSTSIDDAGRTPLSYAAFKGDIKAVEYLLNKFPSCEYQFDLGEEASFPIHKAARGGHILVIKRLANTEHLINGKGQSILHIAAGSGKSELVSHLLIVPEFARQINLKDEDGNTPLHLATLGFHPKAVYILTRDRRVKLEVQNKDGLMALDVAEITAGPNPTFEARLTWVALRYVDAPRASESTRWSYKQKEKQGKVDEEENYKNTSNGKQNRKANDGEKQPESYTEGINTDLLVATLIATVTFAAGFTLPGGYKLDDPQIGMAVLPHKWAFQVFVICNTAAMYSSILTVVTLIWAYMGDLKLVLVSLRFALPMLGFALAMMSLAFMMGLFVVLRNQPWLSYVVLGIGSVSLVVMLLFFVPLYNPSYIRSPVVRFFFSGSFLLLLLVCQKSKIEFV